MAWHLRPITAV